MKRRKGVRRGNGRHELAGVLLAISAVAGVMTLRFLLLSAEAPAVHLQPYQRLDTLLGGKQHTLYQSLLSSVDEIAAIWRKEGRWPTVDRLREEGFSPFAQELLPLQLRAYRWAGFDQTDWMDYLGEGPPEPDRVSFLLRVVNCQSTLHPHPHPNYDPSVQVAGQVWIFRGGPVPYPISSLLEADWLWVVNRDDPSLKDRR